MHAQGFIGIHGLASKPLTEMKQTRYGHGGGLGLEILSNPLNARNGEIPKVQFHLGGGGYYLYTGGRRFEALLDSPQTGMADITAGNHVFALQVIGRVSTIQGRVGAYADVFGGARFLATNQTISPRIKSSEYEDETSEGKQFAVPATYGLGAGLLFRITNNIFLDMGAAYTWGTKAKYVVMKDVYQEGNEIRYPTQRTTTDKLLFRAGIAFRLNFEDCGGGYEGNDYHYDGGTYHTPRTEPKKPNVIRKNPPKVDY